MDNRNAKSLYNNKFSECDNGNTASMEVVENPTLQSRIGEHISSQDTITPSGSWDNEITFDHDLLSGQSNVYFTTRRTPLLKKLT